MINSFKIILLIWILITHCKLHKSPIQYDDNNHNDKYGAPPVQMPLTLLQGGEIYLPSYYGVGDILIGGGSILQITKNSTLSSHQADPYSHRDPLPIGTINIKNKIVIPGLIDVHVHATGGGGELGPSSRTPEAHLDEIIDAGITSIIGLLGTDCVSRSEENLLTKLISLDKDGLSTWMWSGSYHVPPPSITSSTLRDIMLIDKIIGLGEIAISDHRSSVPSFDDIARLVADARVAGMLSGKAGKVHFHVGSGRERLNLLWKIVNNTEIPITQMYPTHMTRNPSLIAEGKKWISEGGYLDFTADSDNDTDTINAILSYSSNRVNLSHVTISSDAYGSLPVFDNQGNVIGYDYGRPSVLINTIRNLIKKYSWTMDKAIQFFTKNPSSYLSLKGKGEIIVGYDADLVVLDKVTLNIDYVIAKGKILKTPNWTKHAMFPCL